MPESGTNVTQTINGFRGENRTAPASQLAIEVSPDAENIDYIDATIKKRLGRLRLHGVPMQSGGIIVQNKLAPGGIDFSLIEIPAASTSTFVNSFEIQLAVIPLFMDAAGGLFVIYQVNTAANEGFKLTIELVGGDLVWRFAAAINGAFVTVTGNAANKAVVDVPQWLQFGVNGDGVNSTVFLKVNGTTFNSASTAGTFDRRNAAVALGIGESPTSQDLDITYDELRFYDAVQTAIPRRELSATEQAVSALKGYWPMDTAPPHPVFLNFFITPDLVGSNDGEFQPDNPNPLGSPMLSLGVSSNDISLSKVLGMAAYRVSGVATQILAATLTDFLLFASNAWTFLSTHQAQEAAPDGTYWYSSAFKDRTIMTNRVAGTFKYDGTNIPYKITPVKPTGGLVASTGAAGNLNGDFTYIVTHYNSADGSESAADTQISGSGGGFVQPASQKVDLSALPLSSDPQVNKKKIYRTKESGAIFYFIAEIDNSTTTYTDNALDATLVTAYNTLLGTPAASRFAFVHDERVWLGNQDGEDSRLVFSEVTTNLNIGGWTQFADDNFADFGRGDGDEMTGGIPVTGGALITKRHSLWLLAGLGPGSYAARQLFGGVGCVSHGTLAASRLGVYLLSASGVVRVPLPLGTATWENLSEESQRDLFEGIVESDWPMAAGVFDTVRQEYRVSFVSDGVEMTLTFHEKSGSWSKSTAHYDSYLQVPFSGGANKLLGAKHGVISELHNGDNEGADIENDTRAWALTGTVDASTTETLQDTSQSFPSRLDAWPHFTLNGLEVTVESAAGVQQRRTIWHNDGDTLYVSPAFSPAPTVGDLYWIAGIDARWKSAKLDLDGNRGSDKSLQLIRTFFRTDGNATNVACNYQFDEKTITDLTFLTSNRIQELTTRDRGKELEIEFSNDQPEEPFEVEALQLGFTQDA